MYKKLKYVYALILLITILTITCTLSGPKIENNKGTKYSNLYEYQWNTINDNLVTTDQTSPQDLIIEGDEETYIQATWIFPADSDNGGEGKPEAMLECQLNKAGGTMVLLERDVLLEYTSSAPLTIKLYQEPSTILEPGTEHMMKLPSIIYKQSGKNQCR